MKIFTCAYVHMYVFMCARIDIYIVVIIGVDCACVFFLSHLVVNWVCVIDIAVTLFVIVFSFGFSGNKVLGVGTYNCNRNAFYIVFFYFILVFR